ncbi:MAG: hypothetical protein AB1489_39210 [Acidobacteriota bacterium]
MKVVYPIHLKDKDDEYINNDPDLEAAIIDSNISGRIGYVEISKEKLRHFNIQAHARILMTENEIKHLSVAYDDDSYTRSRKGYYIVDPDYLTQSEYDAIKQKLRDELIDKGE